MTEELDAYLDRVLIGGREPVTVTVVGYDPGWPSRFEAYADLIRRTLDERALVVEHIGSTAVPGLPAKPIVDMLLTVHDVTDEPAFVPQLEAAGFVLRVREADHLMFRTPGRDVHLHVFEPDRPEVQDYLDLRDWLRVDHADRQHYAVAKRALAGRQWPDMNHYAEAKTAVIEQMLQRARKWRAAGRPRP